MPAPWPTPRGGHLQVARSSYEELLAGVDRIQGISERLSTFTGTVQELATTSRSIREIGKLINDISDQTNLLALNAAIEAARVRSGGRRGAQARREGEVRHRSDRRIQRQHDHAGGEHGGRDGAVNEDARRTRRVVEDSAGRFEGMVHDFGTMNAQLGEISVAVSQLERTHADIHAKVEGIHDLSGDVARRMDESMGQSRELREATERVQGLVSRLRLGNSAFDRVYSVTESYRYRIEAWLSAQAERGLDPFDRDYQPIPGADSPKFRTRYDGQIEAGLRGFLDGILGDMEGLRYGFCVDVNGYTPSHNTMYSQAPTGEREHDLRHCRVKRKFDDDTGLRAARSEADSLLQSYMRDTGELLDDLSMPIRIGGRLWGALRVGFEPALLLRD
jgi:methyl-accepting chemotaxis protein